MTQLKISSTFRIMQFVFIGMFALGLSLMLGEYGNAIHFIFSTFSVTTTVFGAIGIVISEIYARKFGADEIREEAAAKAAQQK